MTDRARRLIATANELLAIAAELDAQSEQSNGADLKESLVTGPDVTGRPDRARLADMARSIYHDRRLRSQIFDDEALFGEPAWDLLLDLFIAEQDRKRVSVTSACIGGAVPATTALRWLSILETRGLIVREDDAHDARRVFVRLSDEASVRMTEYFSQTAPRTAQDTRSLNDTRPHGAGERPFMLSK